MNVTVTVKRAAQPGSAQSRDCGAESCGLLLSRLARAANRSLAASLEELGLRSVHFAILHRLADGGPSSQAELAGSLRIHASNLVRVIDEMDGEGLIVRERDPADRRRQLIVLSGAGAKVLRRAEAAAADTEAQLLAALSPAEQRQLRSLLGRVAAHACCGSV